MLRGMLAISLALVGMASAQTTPIPVLDGALASPFVQSGGTGVITYNDTKGGEACTKIEIADDGGNGLYLYSGSSTFGASVSLAGNNALSGWVWVDSLTSSGGQANGLGRWSLRLYDPAQVIYWATNANTDWFPTAAGEWQHFQVDFSTEAYFDGGLTADPDTWKVSRLALKNDAGTTGTSFWIRDLEFVVADAAPTWHDGDGNKDGMVTDADYTIWADNYGQNPGTATWEQGDYNKDLSVTDADYTVWADNYGFGVTGAVVPEPATMSLLGLGLFGLLRRRS